MNPWPFLALTIIGTVGMFAAFQPWYEELGRVVDREKAIGESTTWRERRLLALWALPVVVFGLSAVVGDVGMLVYLARVVL